MNQKDAKIKASINATKEELTSEQRKLKTLEKNIRIDETALAKKEGDMASMGGMFEKLKSDEENDRKAFEDAQKRLEAVNMGMAINEEGQATSYQDQLTTAKSKIAEATSTIKKSDMELKYSKQTLAKKEKNVQLNDSVYLKDQEVIKQNEREIKTLENQLGKIQYRDGELEELSQQRETLTKECRVLKQHMDRQGGGKFEFHYSDPTQNWDRRRVKGMVANNISVKDQKYSRALSSIMGGGWKSVITDNDETGKLILERGKLDQRVTIIPLNKITPYMIDRQKVALAQNLVGKENAIPAIDLLEYNKEVEPAIQYIFGGTFVCKDLEAAKAVTFNRNINVRSYTLDGDEMSPDGALSGGAVSQGASVLDEIANIKKFRNDYNTKLRECEELARKIESLQGVAAQFRNIKDKIDTVQLQLTAAQERIQQTAFQQDQNEIDELKNKIETLTKTIEECHAIKATNEEKVKDLTAKLADSKGKRV